MTDPTASDPIDPGHIMELRSELTQVRDLTNLSITLQSPLPEPRSTTPNPPCFSSLDSPVPEHFPPQQRPSTNNNLPPTTPANPPNFPPIYTPPQSQPPTYTTYATPPNPPPVNPQYQPPTHTPYVSLPINTYPQPITTLTNPSNPPPPIQSTPTVQTYPTQHIQGEHIASPYAQHVKNDTLPAFDAPIMTTQEQKLIEVTATIGYMPLYNTETPTIWGAEPKETMKNWTCTPSLVRRNFW
ncbi:hypothetical protein H5410_015863 [Solanum commersonii]|uniref:Uncharacterized protein n=1 Tax=Solanum commersonii TaxID=4109 RepID=A0A9J5ZVT8_SOLCO|nr:hypothetical protein H5410_015863 [Solanum commersonii]